MTIGSSFIDTSRVDNGGPLAEFTLRWGTNPDPTREYREPGDNNVGATVIFVDNGVQGSTQGILMAYDVFDEVEFANADTDILILWRPRVSATGNSFQVVCRASGAATAENGYEFRMSSTTLFISEVSAGTRGDLVSTSWAGAVLDQWEWFQFRVIGDELKARQWTYGTTPPIGWDLETTDSTHPALGWVGFGHAAVLTEYEVDYMSIGLNGAYAQFPITLPAAAINFVTSQPAKVRTDATGYLQFFGEPNKAVSWSVSVGDGSITVFDTETSSAGIARARYNPGTAGAHTIEVTYGT